MTVALPSQALLERFAPLRPAPVCANLVMHWALDLFALWDAWETEAGGPCSAPFWAVTWPAAGALSQYLRSGAISLEGRSVLDLGCGGALAALAARTSGAPRVTANDTDPAALAVARSNARANGVELDFDQSDLTRAERWPPHDVVLVADFFYERDAAGALWPKLIAAKRAGAVVLLADAGRTFFPCPDAVLVHEGRVSVDPAVEGTAERTARVYVL